MNSFDASKKDLDEDERREVANLSPDLFEDDMDVDIPDVELESSSRELKLDMPSSVSWRGVSIYDIYKSLSPWSAPEFPLISPSSVHAVLYHISKTAGTAFGKTPPVPQKGKDVWNKDHVRMPCSNESLYTTQTLNAEGQPCIRKRWDIIVEALSQNISNSHELQEAILKYNTRFSSVWKFSGLHKLFNSYLSEEESEYFFNSILPVMKNLALRLPDLVPSPIPLLRHHHNRSISLSQQQIACLLANAFFCTFPRRNAIKGKSEYRCYPEINFYRLFQSTSKPVMEKLKCICNYFRRVCKQVPCGVVTFSRRSIIPSACPEWQSSNRLIGSVPIHIASTGTIEDDGIGLLQVDFANKYLGGGVLNHGCVQEEIRFVICPELLVSMLFTECLKPTESLLMVGCERFNDYKGYADTFEWSGNHVDSTPHDASGRKRCALVAIDALYFSNSSQQYSQDSITRELNKAWVGYSHYSDLSTNSDLSLPAVATGNWGCGAFRGSPHLKALLQLMACCLARRAMVYYTFGDNYLRDDVIEMYNFLCKENVSVGELYKGLCEFQKSSATQSQLYAFLYKRFKDKTKFAPIQPILAKELIPKKPNDLSKFFKKSVEKKPSGSVVVESSQSSDDCLEVQESDVQPKKNQPSELALVDIEKGLDISGQTIDKASNSRLFDEISHLDESLDKSSPNKICPSKKHGSLSFFESKSANTSICEPKVTDPVKSEVISDSKPINFQSLDKDKKKPSTKISDYFQRIPKNDS